MNFIAIIPARYASTRFPGKPLALINNKPMIQHVYEQSKKVFNDVFVATDDKRIADTVAMFGGKYIITRDDHQSGTDRVFEAATKLKDNGVDFDVVVNIQGDEPFIHQKQLTALKECFADADTQIATLIKPIDNADDLFDVNKPKVITAINGNAIYFSRQTIPFIRGEERDNWKSKHKFYKHIGLYAYKFEALEVISNLPQSSLEIAESLEQNRWLENNISIKTAITDIETIGIDTPEDLAKANLQFSE